MLYEYINCKIITFIHTHFLNFKNLLYIVLHVSKVHVYFVYLYLLQKSKYKCLNPLHCYLDMSPNSLTKSFPPCYSQLPLPWYFYFFTLTQPLTFLQSSVTVQSRHGESGSRYSNFLKFSIDFPDFKRLNQPFKRSIWQKRIQGCNVLSPLIYLKIWKKLCL